MKTANITEIISTTEWLKGEHGPLYFIQMKLDNGETITLCKKKKDAFKVGDSVSYEENGEGKRKEVKENGYQKRSFNQERQNLGAMIGMAYKLAFEVFYSKEEKNFADTVKLANAIVEEAMATYKQHEKISA